MPAASYRKRDPLNRRVSTNLDGKLRAAFLARASAAGMSDARYLRHLIEQDAGVASPTEKLRRRTESRIARDNLAHEVNVLGLHFRKIGTNINQMVKQAQLAWQDQKISDSQRLDTARKSATSLAYRHAPTNGWGSASVQDGRDIFFQPA